MKIRLKNSDKLENGISGGNSIVKDIELWHGDCLELMKNVPDESIDLTVTSPPYDNLRSYNGNNDLWNQEVWESVIKELYRITKDGGVVVWIVGDATLNRSETGTSFKQALHFKEMGFNIHDTMIWSKGSCPFPDKTRYYQSFEYMFIFSKGRIKTYNPIEDRKNKWGGTSVHGTLRQADGSLVKPSGMKTKRKVKNIGVRFNVWEQSPERKNETNHPAPFPIRLVQDHVVSWSNKDDVVLDPFMGSGTTGVACLNTKRRFIGMELDEDYFNIAKERIENHEVTE